MDIKDLPIDIHTGKLVDWLISRRHVKKSWPESVQTIREKINAAIQDMPEHPKITKLLSGAYINYFHCLQIEEILQETEKESKNIFGWYTSQRMKDWREIIKLYERDNVYLAEASQYLVRNVAYEIPSLRKQISKCKQIQEDCDKREFEYNKNASLIKERYYATCKKIGIQGKDVKKELLGLVNELPKDFEEIADRTKALEEGRKFYSDFTSFILDKDEDCLPLLKFIMEKGDATVYEWKYNEPPISIEKTEVLLYPEINEETKVDDEIDFGGDFCVKLDEIDLGDEVELTTGDIDWGDIGNEEDKIDWDIEVNEGAVDSADIVVESSGLKGGIASGNDAYSLLYYEKTRNQFINELQELEGFLSQREIELKKEESILSMTLFASAPKRLQYQNKDSIRTYLSDIRSILGDLSSTKMLHLYLISTSHRYVSRLSKSLTDRLKESDRILSTISIIQNKRDEAIRLQNSLSLSLDLIVRKTKELQRDIEKHISLKYDDRPVNLMGGTNAL